MAEIRRAIEAFAFTDHTGVPRVITVGALMSTDDPDYKGKEQLFEPVEVAAARSAKQASGESQPHFPDQEWIDNLPKVEDASAQPNTKRSVTRPRRRGGRTS
jgi:hypothetical protein